MPATHQGDNAVRTVHVVAMVLVIIGALNWGLVGLFDFDLVAFLFGGDDTWISRLIYILVGISGIVVAWSDFAVHKYVRREPAARAPAQPAPHSP